MVDASIARAYDAIAAEYDAQLARNPVAAEMRRQLHAHFDCVFRRGDCVLDFTAGTGADALYLAARGISVTALDASPGMIAELHRNAARRGVQVQARVLAAEHLSEFDAHFDGAISTFAGLNTIDDLPRLARDLAARVKPRGRVILHVLNATCLWHRPSRFWKPGKSLVPHRLYNPFEVSAAFIPYFSAREVYALSVIAAPAVVKRLPRVVPLIFRLDRMLGRLFPARGDFFVLDLERADDRARDR